MKKNELPSILPPYRNRVYPYPIYELPRMYNCAFYFGEPVTYIAPEIRVNPYEVDDKGRVRVKGIKWPGEE